MKQRHTDQNIYALYLTLRRRYLRIRAFPFCIFNSIFNIPHVGVVIDKGHTENTRLISSIALEDASNLTLHGDSGHLHINPMLRTRLTIIRVLLAQVSPFAL